MLPQLLQKKKRIHLLQVDPHYFYTYFLSAVLVSGGTASSASSKKLLQTETYHRVLNVLKLILILYHISLSTIEDIQT
jgi:hypothetical protein